MRASSDPRRSALVLVLLLALGLAGPHPTTAAPLGQTAAEIVLSAADVGPDFVDIASGEQFELGQSWRTRRIARSGGTTYYTEPDGILAVSSVALTAPDPASAQGLFDLVAQRQLADLQELPVSGIGQQARGGLAWGEGPFDPAFKLVLFRSSNVVGYVAVSSFEAPTSLEDVLPLARIMAGRARG